MQDMAASTGGIAYYNRNDIDAAMGEAIATGADYYSLSYVPPPSKYDGKYHKIEVKVDRPGLHLQYREGYTAIDLAKPLPEKKDAKNAPAPDSDFHTAIDHSMIPATGLALRPPRRAIDHSGKARRRLRVEASPQSQAERQAAHPVCADVRDSRR